MANHQRTKVFGRAQLVVGLDLPSLRCILHHALGAMRVAIDQRLPHVFQRQTIRRQSLRLHRHPHRRQSTAANRHLAHAIDLRQTLHQHGRSQVHHVGTRVRGGGQSDDEHRAFRWVDLAISGTGGHARGQHGLRQVDGCLYIASRTVDVAIKVELQTDARAALR